MMDSLCRLPRRVAKCIGETLGSMKLARRADPSNVSPVNPLARLHQVVQNAQPMVEQQLAAARMTEELLSSIERQLGQAWGEREGLIGDYYSLLRSVLTVAEDCRSSGDEHPELRVVRTGLEKTLREHRIEVIPVAEGDAFQPDTQSCEEVEPSGEYAAGTVLRVLEPAYQRRLADGSVVVVRPARVVISQPAADYRGLCE